MTDHTHYDDARIRAINLPDNQRRAIDDLLLLPEGRERDVLAGRIEAPGWPRLPSAVSMRSAAFKALKAKVAELKAAPAPEPAPPPAPAKATPAKERPPLRLADPKRDGGGAEGVRLAVLTLIATDPELHAGTKVLAVPMIWRYWPGSVSRVSAQSMGRKAGLSEPTIKRGTTELKARGYLERYKGGWVWPIVEARIPEPSRVWNKQLELSFEVTWDTLESGKYLRLV